MSIARADEAGSGYLDTITLLQEEIAELQAELRRWDEAAGEAAPARPAEALEDAAPRINELTALLAERDETIGLLCEQLAALEEAGAARAAEWEQMDRWVREIEERIDREGATTPDPEEGRRQAEALRERLEEHERAWAAERARLEREIAALRTRLAEGPGLTGDHARAALEAENHRLRDECRRLAALESVGAEAEALRVRSRDLQCQLDEARQGLDRAADDLRRERFERGAELAALRATLATARAAAPAELSSEERIRALRQHLLEIHEKEEQEREERQLVHRISRLWKRPTPRK